MTYTDESYRALPRYSNSDLGELKRGGKPLAVKPETLAFGTAFHTLVLEPEKFDANPIHIGDLATLTEMHNSILADVDLMRLIRNSQREQVRQWNCPLTNLPLKAKVDVSVMPRHVHLIDLKTTSCTSKAKFIDTLTDYDYDRQAAFYLSSDPLTRYFEFVGVQKQPPYQVFRVSFHITDSFIVGGQQKVAELLKRAKFEALHGGWIPGSWSRNQVGV